jgi:hypothetical protein
MMDQCLITSKDFTQTFAVMHCIILQEAAEIQLLLLSVNARGAHLSQTLGSCNASTMICCTVLKNRRKPYAINRSVTHMSVRPCDFLDAFSVDCCHPGTSSSTSFDVRHLVPARCKDAGPLFNQVCGRHFRALHFRELPMYVG